MSKNSKVRVTTIENIVMHIRQIMWLPVISYLAT